MKQRAVSKIKKTEAATRRSRAIKHGVAESHPVHKSLAEGVNWRRFPVCGTTVGGGRGEGEARERDSAARTGERHDKRVPAGRWSGGQAVNGH